MRRILLTYILLVVGLLTAQAQFNPTQQVDPRTGRDANGNQIDPAMRVHEDSTDGVSYAPPALPPQGIVWGLVGEPTHQNSYSTLSVSLVVGREQQDHRTCS